MRPNKYEYDAFISHAVEDKIPIANELCAKLEQAGLKIWYSGKELGVGDSIEKTIQKGLNRSRYGIVIFSPTYLAKNWTIREFYTLLAKEIEEQKVILPVLYNITLDDLKNKDLVMADRFAVNADKGIDFVVGRLVQEIKRSNAVKKEYAWFTKLWFVLILSLLANVALLLRGSVFSKPGPFEQPEPSFRLESIGDSRINRRTLLDDVNGLFNLVADCQCDHRVETEKSEASHVYKTSFQEEPESKTRGAGSVGDEIAEVEPVIHRSPRKMTMALVFQIETLSDSPPELKQDMNQMLDQVDLHSSLEPLLANAAVAKKRTNGTSSKKNCQDPN
jgi:hypothetical protein